LRRLIRGTASTSPSSSLLPPSLSSSLAPSSLVNPSSPSGSPPSSSSDDLVRKKLPAVRSSSVDSSPCPPLPRRSRALPRTHHRCLHLPVPRQGGTGGPHHRSGTRRPLTRPRSLTPLRPSVEERRPRRRLWGRTLGTSPGWPQIRWRGWKNQRMKRPLQEMDEQDGAVAIGLRKGMNAWCVDAGLNKG
jgi:hypothetical protein